MDESVDLLSAARRQQINLPSPPSSLHRGPAYTRIYTDQPPRSPPLPPLFSLLLSTRFVPSSTTRKRLYPRPRLLRGSRSVRSRDRLALSPSFETFPSFSRVLEGNICRLSFHIPPPPVEGLHKRLYALCGTETPPRRRGGKSATRLLLWIFRAGLARNLNIDFIVECYMGDL